MALSQARLHAFRDTIEQHIVDPGLRESLFAAGGLIGTLADNVDAHIADNVNDLSRMTGVITTLQQQQSLFGTQLQGTEERPVLLYYMRDSDSSCDLDEHAIHVLHAASADTFR